MTTGEKIKELRRELGLTQTQLANLVDTSKQTIYKYENDLITNIPYNRLEDISKALGTTSSYLIGWEDTYMSKMDYITDLFEQYGWTWKPYTHCEENKDCPYIDEDFSTKCLYGSMGKCNDCNYNKEYYIMSNNHMNYVLEEEDIKEMYDKIMSYQKFVIVEKTESIKKYTDKELKELNLISLVDREPFL